ncbi:hypothetical protein ACFLWM_00495 [Chloroflexota bacterium]
MNREKTSLRYVKILVKHGVRKKLMIGAALIPLAMVIASCAGSMEALERDTAPELAPLPALNPGQAPETARTASQEIILEPAPTIIPAATPATFRFTDLVIDPTEVEPGESFLVVANLVNNGASAGGYMAELRVNEITRFTREVSLAAGETVELRVVGRELTPGTYQINLGDLNRQLVVCEPAELLILSGADYDIPQPEAPQDSSGCCGSGSSVQGGCGCGSGASAPASRSGCGCGG